MKLEYWIDPISLEKHYHLVITDYEIIKVGPTFFRSHQVEFDYFNREDASIEERLMGLQLLARGIEENNETTP